MTRRHGMIRAAFVMCGHILKILQHPQRRTGIEMTRRHGMIRAAFVMCGHILKIFLNFSKCFSDAISQMLYNTL